MEFGTDIHSAQRMKPNRFVDPLTFYQAPAVRLRLFNIREESPFTY